MSGSSAPLLPEPQALSGPEVMSLVGFVTARLKEAEDRIVGRLSELIRTNSEAAAERWRDHEAEHTRWCKNLERVEEKLNAHIDLANKRWAAERDEDVRFDARVAPLQRAVRFVLCHWRDIAIFILFIFTMLGISRG